VCAAACQFQAGDLAELAGILLPRSPEIAIIDRIAMRDRGSNPRL